MARAKGGEGQTADLGAHCLVGMGDRGDRMAVYHVCPPRNKVPHVAEGRR